MDAIHTEEVEIARETASVIKDFSSRVHCTTDSDITTVESLLRNQHVFEFANELEKLKVRRNRLAELRTSISEEDLKSALVATEVAITTQVRLELNWTSEYDPQQEEIKILIKAANVVLAPEFEGLKKVLITAKGKNSSKGERVLDVCAICQENWKHTDDVRSIVGCKHVYHYKCISKWMKMNPTCPKCRFQISASATSATSASA